MSSGLEGYWIGGIALRLFPRFRIRMVFAILLRSMMLGFFGAQDLIDQPRSAE